MIVCQCAAVSDGEIIQLAQEGASAAEIASRTGAGQCCTCCHDELVALVDSRQRGRTRSLIATGTASSAGTL